jgi:transcriptional regulator with XRE-family HTH domain
MSTITDNLPRIRRARGFTQEELAERSGVSIDVITRLEQGRKHAARWSTLIALANALDVTVPLLISPPGLIAHDAPGALVDVAALRQAITYTGDIAGLIELAEHEEVLSPTDLRESINALWKGYQEGQFALVASVLPGVIGDVRRLIHSGTGDDVTRAQGLLATCMNASAGITISFGHPDLAYLAIERAVTASRLADSELAGVASAAFTSWILVKQGRYAEAEHVAAAAANRAEPSFSSKNRGQWATFGHLLINSSCAAARGGSLARADDLVETAKAAAARLGRDGIEEWSVFGPRVAAIFAVDNAIEAGDYETALVRSSAIPPAQGGSLPRTWEARYLLRSAYAYSELGNDGAAIDTLVAAKELAPEWICYYPLAANVVTDLLERPTRPNARLSDLATHLRVI